MHLHYVKAADLPTHAIGDAASTPILHDLDSGSDFEEIMTPTSDVIDSMSLIQVIPTSTTARTCSVEDNASRNSVHYLMQRLYSIADSGDHPEAHDTILTSSHPVLPGFTVPTRSQESRSMMLEIYTMQGYRRDLGPQRLMMQELYGTHAKPPYGPELPPPKQLSAWGALRAYGCTYDLCLMAIGGFLMGTSLPAIGILEMESPVRLWLVAPVMLFYWFAVTMLFQALDLEWRSPVAKAPKRGGSRAVSFQQSWCGHDHGPMKQ